MFDAPVIEDSPALAVQRLDGLHLLLVAEEHDARSALEHHLILAGARVTSADSQRVALEMEAASAFDAVVVDVSTAGIDGPSLIRTMRERVAPAGIRQSRCRAELGRWIERPRSALALTTSSPSQ